MKKKILTNNCTLLHNFLKKSFLMPLMPIYELDIVGSFEEPCLLVFPQENLVSRQGVTDFLQTLYFLCYVTFCDVTCILWVSNKVFTHEKHYLDKN